MYKITLKIKKYQFFGLYNFLYSIHKEVAESLQTRASALDPSKFVIFDMCPKITNTSTFHTWQQRNDAHYYNFSLPIGQAITLVRYCFNVDRTQNPELHSFISSLYMRLTNTVSTHILEGSKIKIENFPIKSPW